MKEALTYLLFIRYNYKFNLHLLYILYIKIKVNVEMLDNY